MTAVDCNLTPPLIVRIYNFNQIYTRVKRLGFSREFIESFRASLVAMHFSA